MDVIGVSGFRPELRLGGKGVPSQARVLELQVLEGLVRRHVAGEQAQHLVRSRLAGDLAAGDLGKEPGDRIRRHAVAVLPAVAEGLLASIGVLAEGLLVGVDVLVSALLEETVDGVALLLPLLPLPARKLGTRGRLSNGVDDEARRVVGGNGDHVLDRPNDLRRVLQLPRLLEPFVVGEIESLHDRGRVVGNVAARGARGEDSWRELDQGDREPLLGQSLFGEFSDRLPRDGGYESVELRGACEPGRRLGRGGTGTGEDEESEKSWKGSPQERTPLGSGRSGGIGFSSAASGACPCRERVRRRARWIRRRRPPITRNGAETISRME